jgi:molybdopterin/thiamine biosynthesis adenylyltransferase
MGVPHFRVADLDVVDICNLNRQEGAFLTTVGLNKAMVIANMIGDINPDATVEIYHNGINEENIVKFLSGTTVVLEEIDYRAPQFTLIVHRAARALGLHVFTGIPIAWNAFLFHFAPNGLTYEEYVGIDTDHDGTISSTDVKVTAFVPEPPMYVGIDVLRTVLAEQADIPCVAPGVDASAALTASNMYFHISGTREVLTVPYYYSTGDMYLQPARRLNKDEEAAINGAFTAE